MSTYKQQQPKVDFGFYAVIPRVIRTHYKDLTATQKWLYVCLKDLCGDHGTCYRTLRVLSEETCLSIGLLSESIQLLHQHGLIHAEKKRRKEGGKEVWHIKMIDIWQANAKAHPTKCSPGEQCEQTSLNVHSVNNDVHSVNNNREECSPSEQECSQNDDRRNTNRSKNNSEGITREGNDTLSPDSSIQASSSSESSPHTKEERPPVSSYNDESICETFYQRHGCRPLLASELVKDEKLAAKLNPRPSCEQVLAAVIRMEADPFWKGKPFEFATFVKHLPKYLHAPEKQNGKQTPLQGAQAPSTMSETTKRNIERLKASVAQKKG